MKIGIVGIHTGIGKTFVASFLTNLLQCDYWKPIQAGKEPITDTEFIKQNLSNPISKIHDEYLILKNAISPHEALKKENIFLNIKSISTPNYNNNFLLIETAGGILSPVTDSTSQLDLLSHLKVKNIILVVSHYLGSINHTMLTIKILQLHYFNILGIVFNNEVNEESEQYILQNTQLQCLFKMNEVDLINTSILKLKLETEFTNGYIN